MMETTYPRHKIPKMMKNSMSTERTGLLEKYQQRSRKLDEVRARHGGAESPEEDELLEELDELWWNLSREEKKEVEAR